MRVIYRSVVAIIAAIAMVFAVSGCTTETEPDAQINEGKSGQQNYDNLAKQQPAKNMDYSATRDTINFFTDVWGKKGTTAYTYLFNQDGKVVQYLVSKGRPVSMCTSLRPTYKLLDPSGDGIGANLVVPAPGTDGAYYSGGECTTYYAESADAPGTYVEFGPLGQGITRITYSQPIDPRLTAGAINLASAAK